VARSSNVGGENPEFVFREFMGMNLLEAREAINDNEFFWCENIIPVAAAAAYPVPSAIKLTAQLVSAETTSPSYTMSFSIGSTDYVFVVFSASGNAYICNLTVGSVTFIIGGMTSGFTYATAYNNQGILIIDPTGYWDWNITTLNVVTAQNNTAAFATLVGVAGAIAGGTALQQILTASGHGALFEAQYQVINATVTSGGTGYAVGDSINLTDGLPSVAATIIVASVSGGGVITGITLASGGTYPGPKTSFLGAIGPTGSVSTTTGSGTGATFTDHIQAVSMSIIDIGSGYVGTTTVVDQPSGGPPLDTWNITSSGVIGGQSIATYQGRVWISFNRTVFFTDIDSYNSFGGVGGSFFISDSYLVGNISVLYAANNYLYIFGASSIDALSNVTVAAGVTSFSRINVTGSVGTVQPTSVTAYYRAILFFHPSGIYLLAGATPERISDKISQIVTAYNGSGVFGFSVQVQGEICAAMQLNISDTFTQGGTVRPLITAYFRGRWWVSSFTNINPGSPVTAITSIPVNGVYTAYGWRLEAHPQLYQLFGGVLSAWLVKSKFWDGGTPTREKQAINVAVGGLWPNGGVAGGGITVNVDTELGTAPANLIDAPTAGSTGYNFKVTIGNEGGSQYLGLTVAGASGTSQSLTRLDMLALRGKTERDKLQ
jgi:hypothetical protein